jgi:undecaprenyl-phosphate 4-deoxy-4-formamido-L-arabinose transferase
MRGVSVVVPVYESEQSLAALVGELFDRLPAISEHHEIILVDDGSSDASWTTIERLARERPDVRGLKLMRNYGQHNALLAGIRAARYDTIVTMDDDLQHPPAEVSKLLARLDEGFDVVYGVPAQQQHGLLRDLASFMTKLALQGTMGADNARNTSAFRAFRTELRQASAAYAGPFVSIDVLLTWGTRLFSHVVVRHEPRRLGTSKYTVRKLITHALNMMTGFSTLPLQLASILGFAFTLFGVALFGYVLINYFFLGGSVPGFTFIVSVIALFSGAQLFAIGVIGEYLARVHFRLMDKPPYAVRRDTASGVPR